MKNYRIFRNQNNLARFDIWVVTKDELKIAATKHVNLSFETISDIYEEFYA